MAATVLGHFSPITSSLKPPSRHRRFLHHNLSPKTPLQSSLIKFGAENSEPQPPRPLPETDCPVPPEQQPINEYQSLSTSFPFSWASGDLIEYSTRLFFTGASFAFFVGLPVSWFGSIGPEYEPVKRILAASSSGIFVVTLAVVRMYLGWAYVGNRLLSATVEYEETGWYDGQVWVKTPEVLARDRLLGSFSVKPVLARLKNTLVILGLSLILVINLGDSPIATSYRTYRDPRDRSSLPIPGAYNDETARTFEPEAFCGNSADSGDVDFSILIKNEMYNVDNPSVFYNCRSSKKDIGWHKSVPSSEFQWEFEVPQFGNGVMVHNCRFRSSAGTANVEIRTLSTTAMLCDGQTCKYAIRPNGIYFIGYELYSPYAIFGRYIELSRPAEKLVEPWKPWSPQQLKVMHRTQHGP
ncbi:unnamed protein product [Arabidopsis thaliana]|uniref:(thale cress) hypothetical protein n=1 Tax=Arabidopsis thaliana TaxID=3702 RepID=A0A7G2FCZ8_ARATH|nr:unnamed protein product [Arabidopsis thaliana]